MRINTIFICISTIYIYLLISIQYLQHYIPMCFSELGPASDCECAVVLILDGEGGGVVSVHHLEADGAGVHAHEDDRVGLQVGPGVHIAMTLISLPRSNCTCSAFESHHGEDL